MVFANNGELSLRKELGGLLVDIGYVEDMPRVLGDAFGLLGTKLDPSADNREGVFVSWDWNGRELSVTNDLFGMYPVFYFSTDERFVLARSIEDLARQGVPLRLDDDAMSVFLRLGFFVAEDTPFLGIRALPPGATLRWSRGRVSLESRKPPFSPRLVSPDAATDLYIECIRAAVERWLPPDENVLFPLSGGRDSRLMAFELHRLGFRPRYVVTSSDKPLRPEEDVRVARGLCARMGWDHLTLDSLRDWHDGRARHYRATSFCADEGMWLEGLVDRYDGRVSAVFDGAAGDSFASVGYFLTEERIALFRGSDVRAMAANLLGHAPTEFTEEGINAVLRPSWRDRFGIERAMARLARELPQYLGQPDPCDTFFFWNRTRREIAFSVLAHYRSTARVVMPYLEESAVMLTASLPIELTFGGKWRDSAIRSAFPQFADIPFEDKSAPWMDVDRKYAEFARRLALDRAVARPSALVDEAFVRPRLLRALVDRKYAARTRWFVPIVHYLLEIEKYVNECGSRAESSTTAGGLSRKNMPSD